MTRSEWMRRRRLMLINQPPLRSGKPKGQPQDRFRAPFNLAEEEQMRIWVANLESLMIVAGNRGAKALEGLAQIVWVDLLTRMGAFSQAEVDMSLSRREHELAAHS